MSQQTKQSIPDEGIFDVRQLGTGKALILGLQHTFAMFGATVLVPLLTGLDVSTTLLCAGLGTLLFHLITKGKEPILCCFTQSLQFPQKALRRGRIFWYDRENG